VAQEDTTICVPEGFAGTVDAYGNILLSLGQ
jgi:N-methylhydantoinase A